MNLPTLNFPELNIKIRSNKTYYEIYDCIRKKWIKLTPEEWVRQHLIKYLIEIAKCPPSLIQVEYSFSLFQKNFRIDVAVFSNNLNPILLCECKAYNVELTYSSLTQLAYYNLHYKTPCILLTNGLKHILFYYNDEWKIDYKIPTYTELQNMCKTRV
jgi:hypothetical protein